MNGDKEDKLKGKGAVKYDEGQWNSMMNNDMKVKLIHEGQEMGRRV